MLSFQKIADTSFKLKTFSENILGFDSFLIVFVCLVLQIFSLFSGDKWSWNK